MSFVVLYKPGVSSEASDHPKWFTGSEVPIACVSSAGTSAWERSTAVISMAEPMGLSSLDHWNLEWFKGHFAGKPHIS